MKMSSCRKRRNYGSIMSRGKSIRFTQSQYIGNQTIDQNPHSLFILIQKGQKVELWTDLKYHLSTSWKPFHGYSVFTELFLFLNNSLLILFHIFIFSFFIPFSFSISAKGLKKLKSAIHCTHRTALCPAPAHGPHGDNLRLSFLVCDWW